MHTITIGNAAKLIGQPNVVFMDTQFIFGQSAKGRSFYEEKHIPGAVYFHLDEDLSGPIEEHGGRHPIPNSAVFEEKLRAAGVSDDSTVIVYDNTGGATAARGWWLLIYFGHEHAVMLEQSIEQWVEAGYPVTVDESAPQRGNFTAREQLHLTVDVEDVLQQLGSESRILIDARVEDVYSGARATKYNKLGHIPGALNIFWERLLDDEGRLRNSALLKQLSTQKDEEIVVYCGAGVTACANILALENEGYTNVKLYVGSWGDWASYEHTPAEVSEAVRHD